MQNEFNNFKLIREIYGTTQDELSTAIGVNRATISNWETGASRASSSNLERLSIYFGIGPEYFYELEIDDNIRQMLISASQKQKQIESDTQGKRKKADELHGLFESISFIEASKRYMFSMKLLLAAADTGNLSDLKTAYQINVKMGARLKAIIDLRDAEEKAKKENNEETLFELLDEMKNSLDEH